MPKKKTTKEFIIESKEVHGDKYDYSKVEYTGNKNKVEIICKKHIKPFYVRPNDHLSSKSGCPLCKSDKISLKLSKDSEYFISKSRKYHGNKYDYSLVNYINNKTPVIIICAKHGVFEQIPDVHYKCNCPKCVIEMNSNKRKMNIVSLKRLSNKAHNNRYDYSMIVDFKNNKSKIEIICTEHGVFEQRIDHHIQGAGCPKCNFSSGELYIMEYLDRNEIKYKREYKFNDCKHKKHLRFDFYLPKHNICIEFDGIQHFKPIEYFGGEDSFNLTKKRDEIKNKYCESNDIKLRELYTYLT